VVKQPKAMTLQLSATLAASDTASGADMNTSTGAPTTVSARLDSESSCGGACLACQARRGVARAACGWHAP
jgi:hypothetical protein